MLFSVSIVYVTISDILDTPDMGLGTSIITNIVYAHLLPRVCNLSRNFLFIPFI